MNRHDAATVADALAPDLGVPPLDASIGLHPPRPRMALNVGITGHRAAVLPDGALEALRPIVDDVFRNLREAVLRLHTESQAIFSEAAPKLRLHTPLATGADQLAADSARANAYRVRALLPFTPDVYRKDFEGQERKEFGRQLELAEEIFALPCDRTDGDAAYVEVGRAVIAAADLLVAIWDGRSGNGPGGTAHVVQLALRAGVPIIHVKVDRASGAVSQARLLVRLDNLEDDSQPLPDADAYFRIVADTLAPHTAIEREQLACYFSERETRTNWRIEYPLLLAVLGIKRLPSRPWRQSSVADDVRSDWQDVHAVDPPGAREPLARAYGWANFLAIRYAQLFRSGHVTNYVLAALAVILALLGLVVPKLKALLVVLELATIGVLLFNTRAGRQGEWHRRWLQYRHLAESLRPLVYLKRSGMVSAPFRSDIVRGPLNREAGADWTRWYAAAIWREMASPVGVMDTAMIRQLGDDVLDEQVVRQAAYHRANAERMHKLDHRLHGIGNILIGAVIATCILFLAGYVVAHDWVIANTEFFILLTAGLPAIGSAVFGLRGHGEHLVAANRSAQTALALEANAARLKQVNRLDELAVELEATAAIMLADLTEWTLAYRERSLEIPA